MSSLFQTRAKKSLTSRFEIWQKWDKTHAKELIYQTRQSNIANGPKTTVSLIGIGPLLLKVEVS